MTSPKSSVKARIEGLFVILGALLGAGVMFWAITAQDSAAVMVGSIMLSPIFPAAGGALGEWLYEAARRDGRRHP